jgi:dolichol-phosphate mannosyltransferase
MPPSERVADTVAPVPRSLRRRLTTWRNWLQLIQFGLVGFSGFIINTAIYATLVKRGHVGYLLAATIAFVFAVTNNFFWNRHWTFRHRRDASHAGLQGTRFLLVSLFGLGVNLVVLHLLVQSGVDKILAQIIAVILVVPVSFLGNKLWSFR